MKNLFTVKLILEPRSNLLLSSCREGLMELCFVEFVFPIGSHSRVYEHFTVVFFWLALGMYKDIHEHKHYHV